MHSLFSKIGKQTPKPVLKMDNNFYKHSDTIEKILEQPKHLGHVMIDIETLGTKPGCVILSIAAVEFDIVTGTEGRRFVKNISTASCEAFGLRIEYDTLRWWLQQSPPDGWMKGDGIISVMLNLNVFLIGLGENVKVWANSPSFDLAIIKHVFSLIKTEVPWKYHQEMDVRTLAWLRPDVKAYTPFEGKKHDALADAIHQIMYCHNIWKELNK